MGNLADAPARPSPHHEACPHCGEAIPVSPGLTKREEFAEKFMTALLMMARGDAEIPALDIAQDAVKLADALMAALAVQ